MDALIAFWSHALAAMLFAALMLWRLGDASRQPAQRLLLARIRAHRLLGVAGRRRAAASRCSASPKARATCCGSACSTACPRRATSASTASGSSMARSPAVHRPSADRRRAPACSRRATRSPRPASSCASPPPPARWSWCTTFTARPRRRAGRTSASQCSASRLMWVYDLNLYTVAYLGSAQRAAADRMARRWRSR